MALKGGRRRSGGGTLDNPEYQENPGYDGYCADNNSQVKSFYLPIYKEGNRLHLVLEEVIAMEWVSAIFLFAQTIVLLIGYFKLYRNRVIYSIETDVLRMPHGEHLDKNALEKEHINEKLKNGEYTILQIVERPDQDLEIIYGKIKRQVRQ